MRYDKRLNKVVFTREFLEGNDLREECLAEMDILFGDAA